MVRVFGKTVFRTDAVDDDDPPPSTSTPIRRIQLPATVFPRTAGIVRVSVVNQFPSH